MPSSSAASLRLSPVCSRAARIRSASSAGETCFVPSADFVVHKLEDDDRRAFAVPLQHGL